MWNVKLKETRRESSPSSGCAPVMDVFLVAFSGNRVNIPGARLGHVIGRTRRIVRHGPTLFTFALKRYLFYVFHLSPGKLYAPA